MLRKASSKPVMAARQTELAPFPTLAPQVQTSATDEKCLYSPISIKLFAAVPSAAKMQIPCPQFPGVDDLFRMDLTASEHWQIPSPPLWVAKDPCGVVMAASLQHQFLLAPPTLTLTSTQTGKVQVGSLVKTVPHPQCLL